ncbi:GM23501 [Drosophila sechellia]|uniref:GM23501 n=1 Tax=Drosophila sechellia TaxID=7238 RepID=B4IMH4_DROSE|nr:GM23501 [Drosophila sechellia]
MGSPGSQASAIATSVGIRSGRRGQAGVSLLLRLLAVTFVLAACHAPLTNAKVSSFRRMFDPLVY